MKILHLSDLHIGAEASQNTAVRDRIAYIRNHYPEHFYIITGDIIDNEGNVPPGTSIPSEEAGPFLKELVLRQPVEVHLAKTRQALQNARQILNMLPAERLYFCCGNHDVAVMGNLYDGKYAAAFDELLWKPLNHAHTVLPLGFDSLGGASSIDKTPLLYNFPALADGTIVRVIALNTCPDTSQNVSPVNLASGIVGGAQLNKLQQALLPNVMIPGLSRSFPMITLMFFHHHPWVHVDWLNWRPQLWDMAKDVANEFIDKVKETNMKLLDSDQLMGIIQNNVDLLLFGHRHQPKQYASNGSEARGLRFGALAAGSSRFDRTAWEITLSGLDAVSIGQVPII